MSRPNPLAPSAVSLLAPPGDERPRGRPADPQKFAVQVGESRIDGQGAFAAEAMPARRKIGEIRGESISVREARRRAKGQARIMIVEVRDTRAIDASQSSDPLRYTNHSCRPNAVLRIRQGRVEFYAMRDIAVGEEITVELRRDAPRGPAALPLRRAGLRRATLTSARAPVGHGRADKAV